MAKSVLFPKDSSFAIIYLILTFSTISFYIMVLDRSKWLSTYETLKSKVKKGAPIYEHMISFFPCFELFGLYDHIIRSLGFVPFLRLLMRDLFLF